MDGMVIFGVVIGAVALIGIVGVYIWGEVKTPGWGWKKQVEHPNATNEAELNQQAQEVPAGQAPQSRETGVSAPGPQTSSPPTGNPEQELEQAIQQASKEREGSFSR